VPRLRSRGAAVPADEGFYRRQHAALEAYILDSERWNGWVLPWFDRYHVHKYLAWQKQYGGRDEVRFDPDKDAVLTKLEGEEEADEWAGEDIE
jgi:hypothetical protein